MTHSLTPKQRELLDFIKSYIDANGVGPSFEEMRKHLGQTSKSGIHRLLAGLEERGLIKRLAYRARAIEIPKLPEIASEIAELFNETRPGHIAAINRILTAHFG